MDSTDESVDCCDQAAAMVDDDGVEPSAFPWWSPWPPIGSRNTSYKTEVVDALLEFVFADFRQDSKDYQQDLKAIRSNLIGKSDELLKSPTPACNECDPGALLANDFVMNSDIFNRCNRHCLGS